MKLASRFGILLLTGFFACGEESTPSANVTTDTIVEVQDTIPEVVEPPKAPFVEIDTNYNSEDLLLPEGFRYEILFTEKRDSVTRADGMKFPAKGKHDLCVYIPINNSSEHGYLYVGHEDRYANADLGDGGGGTVFEVKKTGDSWNVVSEFKHVDFYYFHNFIYEGVWRDNNRRWTERTDTWIYCTNTAATIE